MKNSWIIGIDEVGRGSLAGPVTVAVLAVPANFRVKMLDSRFGSKKQSYHSEITNHKSKIPLRDSKKLSPRQREQWFAYIKNHPKISYAVSHISPVVIDRINISQAANRAASSALEKLETKISANNSKFTARNAKILIDGGLYLGDKKHADLKAKTIIKGDEKFKPVMLASIVAKVTRDRLMRRLHKKYPEYGFDVHKGYGTRAHRAAVRRFGPSEKHRITFI